MKKSNNYTDPFATSSIFPNFLYFVIELKPDYHLLSETLSFPLPNITRTFAQRKKVDIVEKALNWTPIPSVKFESVKTRGRNGLGNPWVGLG